MNFVPCGCRFVWDEAKYPTMSPLREIVDGIHGQVAKIEDDLKVCFFTHYIPILRITEFHFFFFFFVLYFGCKEKVTVRYVAGKEE